MGPPFVTFPALLSLSLSSFFLAFIYSPITLTPLPHPSLSLSLNILISLFSPQISVHKIPLHVQTFPASKNLINFPTHHTKINQSICPQPSAASIASSDTILNSRHHHQSLLSITAASPASAPQQSLSRYESQKRRDWNTFGQYLKNHRPPLTLSRCSGAHVLEFLRYLDQFGKTKIHADTCPFYGQPQPPVPCPCPLRQAWGSLDALIGRLRAAFEENGGQPETNPFGARAVRLYLREVRDSQAKARGIAYEKKKRKKPPTTATSQQYYTTNSTASTTNNNVSCDHDYNYDRNGQGMSSSSGRGSISSMIPLAVLN